MCEISAQLKTIKTPDEIKKRVVEIGRSLTEKFKGREPICVCVLNGSFMFYSDLIRAIDLDVTCEFLGVSTYKNQRVSTGEVEITLDISFPLQGKDVILIEDLVDSGLTMNYLIKMLQARGPRSLTTVSLLLKPKALIEECHLDYVGFEVPNDFVVGYGIDYAGDYRNMPSLAVLKS